jgi:hypothetical protein
MLKSTSLPDGMTLPRLRWARKEQPHPTSPAHLAVAFDTFASSVVAGAPGERRRPYFAFGLMSFFQREYHSLPSPVWKSAVVGSADGEKHPADRTPTERLVKLQEAMDRCVVRHLGATQGIPILQTEIPPEKA